MYPTKEAALTLLKEAVTHNPGPWEAHSLCVAHCAEAIAARSGLNVEKAYVLGLLHDIGRRFGVFHLRHVYEGYKYMTLLGYDEVAKICLTHSFAEGHGIDDYVGNHDLDEDETVDLLNKLSEVKFDDYDKLIHLCDACGTATGVAHLEDRMGDVKARYGDYPVAKWNYNFELKGYFEMKMGMDLYEAVGMDTYRPAYS